MYLGAHRMPVGGVNRNLFRVSICDCSIACLLLEVHKNDVLSGATFCSFVRVLHTRNYSLNFD
jgi:hypothetical protein